VKTYVHLWQYLVEFFIEWEMFDTKILEKIKTHILCSITFFPPWKSYRLWDNVEKYCTARQATDGNIIWRMRVACWIPKAAKIHSEYVILIAFPLQHWLHERLSVLRYTYVACLVKARRGLSGQELRMECVYLLDWYILFYQAALCTTLKMETSCHSETFLAHVYQNTCYHFHVDRNFRFPKRENCIFHKINYKIFRICNS
jgi:hypothetical protein